MLKIAMGAAAVAGFCVLSLWNYRRFMPKPRPLGSTAYRVTTKKLPVQAQGHTLYGELLLPQNRPGPLPTVICCHGFGSSYRLCKNTVGMCLAMSGFAVYCFDFYGGSKTSRSGGSMLEMSIFTQRQDLEAVIEAMAKHPLVNSEQLFLVGESQGGCVAGITAPCQMEKLRAMVLYYPAFCIPDDARKRFASAEAIPPVNKVFGQSVGRAYSEKLLDYDIFEEIKAFEKPVLILHGNGDQVVDVRYGERAAQVYPRASLEILPGEPHGFTAKGKLRAAQAAHHFFTEQMAD